MKVKTLAWLRFKLMVKASSFNVKTWLGKPILLLKVLGGVRKFPKTATSAVSCKSLRNSSSNSLGVTSWLCEARVIIRPRSASMVAPRSTLLMPALNPFSMTLSGPALSIQGAQSLYCIALIQAHCSIPYMCASMFMRHYYAAPSIARYEIGQLSVMFSECIVAT